MFQSAGFFRGVVCPQNGLGERKCKRPYCHFRHIRTAPPVEQATEPKKVDEQKRSKPAIESSSLPSHRRPKDRTQASKPIQYIPTPLFLCKKPLTEDFQASEEFQQPEEPDPTPAEEDYVPSQSSYTPTPLVELEAMKEEEEDVSEGSDQSLQIDWSDTEHQQDVDLYADLPTKQENGNGVQQPAKQKPSIQSNQQRSKVSDGLQKKSSTANEEEMEDVIIQTHTYGGVTVTTKTPRSMCHTGQSSSEGDEYDPFSSDFAPGEDDSSEKTEESSLYDYQDNLRATADESQLDSKFDVAYGDDHYDYEIPQTTNNDAAYSFDVLPEQYAPVPKETGFKSYSQAASYSYSESKESEFNKPFGAYNDHAASDADTCERTKQPIVSKSKSAIKCKDARQSDTRTLDSKNSKKNLQGVEKSGIKKVSLKPGQEKSGNAKLVSKKIVKSNNEKQKVVSGVKKEGVISTKKLKTTATISSPKVMKVVQSTEKNKLGHIEKKSTTKKVVSDGKEHKTAKKTMIKTDSKSKTKDGLISRKGDASKSTSKPSDSEKAIAEKMVKTKEVEKAIAAKLAKAKVASEEMSSFFKRRQELKAAKPPVKGSVSNKGQLTQKSSSASKKVEHLKPKKTEHQKAKSCETNSVKEKVVPTSKSGTGNNYIQKSKDNDRSLFKSLEQPVAKTKPRKPSVQDCPIDIFAIATDDTSSDEDLDDTDDVRHKMPTPKPKTSISSKSSSTPTSKQSSSKSKLMPKRSSSEELHAKKRPASPTKYSDSKRQRKSSLSLSRQESTKIVELDLFGDDSDEDSLPEINFLGESEDEKVSMKSPKKSQVSSHFKEKSVHSHSKLSSSGNTSVSYSSKSSEKTKDKSAGNFLPTPKKSSTFESPTSSSSKNVKTHLKPKSVNGTDRSQRTVSGDKKMDKTKSVSSSGHSNRNHKGQISVNKYDDRNADRNQKRQISMSKSGHKKSPSREVYDISSSDDDLPDALAVSDDENDNGDGYNDHSNHNDHKRHTEESPDRYGNSQAYNDDYGDDAYMEDMKKFLEQSSEEEEEGEDTFDECYRIFQEDRVDARSANGQKPKKPRRESDDQDAPTSGKQRVAHSSKYGGKHKQRAAPTKPANMRPTPAQMCHQRYLMMQQRAARGSQGEEAGGSDGPRSQQFGKKRVAHQPGSSNATLQQLTLGSTPSKKTTAMSNSKMGKRVAHTPKTVSKRPMIPTDYGSKVPMNVRQRYLNVFIDELLKTAEEDQEAFDKALDEEKKVYQRSSTKNIYLNLCVNALKKLRNATASMLESPEATPTVTSPTKLISHEAVLGGKLAAMTSFSIHKHVNAVDTQIFEGVHLYAKFRPYILTEELLRDNGYPRPTDTPGQAIVYKERDSTKVTSSDPNQQICCRCGSTFLRRPNGKYISREQCTYHWGRAWTRRVAGLIESRFSCCQGDMEAKGCCIAKLHVTQDKLGNTMGFMKTIPKATPRKGHPGMYALDCEMCYTTIGLELTRVTVVNDQLDEVYDTLVIPDNDVIDYNTRFSGITENDLKHITTKLRDVQAVLLSMFSASTILIGHSLESDLLSLKLLHDTVIDTAVVFPHRRGPPYKRALKTLMAEFLKRLIQDDVGGHDSAEDARSCMELMIWRVKEDAKVKRKR